MEIGEVETKIKGEVARRNLRRVTFTVTIAKDMNTLLMNPMPTRKNHMKMKQDFQGKTKMISMVINDI